MGDYEKVKSKVISQEECREYQEGEYRVKTVCPLCTDPYFTEYIIRGEDIIEAMKDWFGVEVAEFVVGVERIGGC